MKEIEEAYDMIVVASPVAVQLGVHLDQHNAPMARWRKVEIRVRTPAASGARIQSRKGYFAPYRAN